MSNLSPVISDVYRKKRTICIGYSALILVSFSVQYQTSYQLIKITGDKTVLPLEEDDD